VSAAIPENCFEMKSSPSPGCRERDPASYSCGFKKRVPQCGTFVTLRMRHKGVAITPTQRRRQRTPLTSQTRRLHRKWRGKSVRRCYATRGFLSSSSRPSSARSVLLRHCRGFVRLKPIPRAGPRASVLRHCRPYGHPQPTSDKRARESFVQDRAYANPSFASQQIQALVVKESQRRWTFEEPRALMLL
jgi:hypothetical protein